MKYMMLINLGKARDWRNLSEEEQKQLAEGFQALNATPGVRASGSRRRRRPPTVRVSWPNSRIRPWSS